MIKAFFKILSAAAVILVFSAPRGICAAPENEWPLELVNESGVELTELRISRTGMGIWSDNLIPSAIASGGRKSLDIGRASILGLCDVKVTAGGREAFWRRLPMLEIFSVTVDEKLEPRYERIKLGA